MGREMAMAGCDSQLLTSRGARDWRRLAELGRRQHGVVSSAQLVACGFTEAGIASLAQAVVFTESTAAFTRSDQRR